MDPVSLVVGGALGAAASAAVRHGREHRGAPTGLADLLLWAFLVDDGVILQKDGSLIAAFRYRGPDASSATAAELHALHIQLNDAILPYTDGWMFHVDAIRAPSASFAAGRFPTEVTTWIEAERQRTFTSSRQQFVSEYVLSITYLPPRELYARAARMFVKGATELISWRDVLSRFHSAIETLERRLAAHLRVERLCSDALVTHLHRCLTSLDHAVVAPPHGAYLDTILASQEMIGGFTPTIGAKHLRVVAIAGYPAATTPGRLDFLDTLALPYRWSSRWIALGTPTAAALIRRHQRRWFMSRRGVASFLRELSTSADGKGAVPSVTSNEALFEDRDAVDMTDDAAGALAINATGALRFGFATQVIVIAEDEARLAEERAASVVGALQDHGFAARIERINAMDAFFGSLPGQGHPNLRRPLISTANVVDLWPVTSVWPGLSHNPSPFFPPNSPPLTHVATDGSTPFRLNLHVSDLGHTLVVGAPGAGKSTLVGFLVAQWQRYVDVANANTFVFDVGYSHWLLAKASEAPHFDIGMDSVATASGMGTRPAIALQPLANVDDVTERVWAANWLELLIELQGVVIDARQRARIEHALTLLAAEPRRYRTLTELVIQLQDRALADALAPYTVAGAYGQLLDASDDGIDERTDPKGSDATLEARRHRHQVFELRRMLDLDDRILVPVLLYLFHRIERALDGRPTLIVIEELWAPLMRSVFATRIKQWLLTLRKQNAAVVLVAHSLAQLDQIPAKQVLFDSCPTRILLPNPEATNSGNLRLYRDLGLNDREIGAIASATPKRDYYVQSPLGSRLVQLELGPVALAFLGTPPGLTIDATRPLVEALAAAGDPTWPRTWLTQLGVPVPAESA